MLSAMRSTSRHHALATALGILAIVLWGTTVAVMRSIVEQMSPMSAAAASNFIGGAVGSLVVVAGRGRFGAPWRLPWRHLLAGGAMFTLYNAVFFLAIEKAATRTQAVEVGLVNYLWPALTLVFSVPILRHRARLTLWPGLLIAMAGVCWAMAGSNGVSFASFQANLVGHPAPYALAAVAAVTWGLYSNLTRRWAGDESPGNAVPFFLLITGVCLTVLAWATGAGRPPAWPLGLVAALLYLALVPTLVGYVLWDAAMRKGNNTLVASLSFFVPLISTVISCVALRVPMTLHLGLACGLVIAGAVLCRRSISEPASSRTAATME
jgi:drug/metabolite transporter (DMT)-like permease